MNSKAVTVNDFRRMKRDGIPIATLTAYDAAFARLVDEAGIDLILVGDSLANVVQGRETTIPVTIDDMIYHGEIVARVVKRAFVVVDMPFMSYQVNPEDALRNAGRIMKATGCRAVKIEGGVGAGDTIRAIVRAGIPVMGHIGLTPQSVHVFGGFGVRGRENADKLVDDARAVQDAGAFAVVVEKVPRRLAADITAKLDIPTIGIGAGPDCDGQILVINDMLGLTPDFHPRFVRRYAEIAGSALKGLKDYADDVRGRRFPSDEESYE